MLTSSGNRSPTVARSRLLLVLCTAPPAPPAQPAALLPLHNQHPSSIPPLLPSRQVPAQHSRRHRHGGAHAPEAGG